MLIGVTDFLSATFSFLRQNDLKNINIWFGMRFEDG
jgi:hypothetical protein